VRRDYRGDTEFNGLFQWKNIFDRARTSASRCRFPRDGRAISSLPLERRHAAFFSSSARGPFASSEEFDMNDLLKTAIQAHGGLDRWQRVGKLRVEASITGAIWFVKGQGDYLKHVVMDVDTKRQHMITEVVDRDRRFVFGPSQLAMEKLDGTLLLERDSPATAFAGQTRETPWDELHVAYFQSEALWTYLNTPFLYAREGFLCEEIEPIEVDGEKWRRLRVIFPDSVKSHTREQISCFGPDGLLRRHDYTVDILGGATGLNYACDYRTVDGIVFPTKRRVYAYEGDYVRVPEPVLVQIDISAISVFPA
jgi:hypothetical protein